MKPFFTYFGGKFLKSKRYPKPKYNTVIEPFAGSAGYALRYYWYDIILYETDEKIFGVWNYLKNVNENEIINLPLWDDKKYDNVDDMNIPQEAKWLIGFWLTRASPQPGRKPSTWMMCGKYPECFWSENIKHRIANQLKYIRHWKIYNESYENAPDLNATWFIDPPYMSSGYKYKKSLKTDDYEKLKYWILNRKGQVIVCENGNANWLPFKELYEVNGTPGKGRPSKNRELMYYFDNDKYFQF